MPWAGTVAPSTEHRCCFVRFRRRHSGKQGQPRRAMVKYPAHLPSKATVEPHFVAPITVSGWPHRQGRLQAVTEPLGGRFPLTTGRLTHLR